ncbi:hypothetical protein SNE40_017145 [Patella caerulea]|uniref:Uncharacterized protein n=1 Tax=Patella caerulea TaxID=87958 RepID=A0AAN8PKY9_PATCE
MVYRRIVTCVLLIHFIQFCPVESLFTPCSSQNVPYVEVCVNKSLTGSTVYLSSTRTPGDNLHCNCTLKFTGQPQQTVYIGLSPINATTYGCQFELAIRHKNNTGEFSCAKYNGYSYRVDIEDMIEIELISGINPNSDSEFLTCLETTTTPGSQVTLACNEETFPTDSSVSVLPITTRPNREFTTTPTNSSSADTISIIKDLISWILLGVSLLLNIIFTIWCIRIKCCKREIDKKENLGNNGGQLNSVTNSNLHPVNQDNTILNSTNHNLSENDENRRNHLDNSSSDPCDVSYNHDTQYQGLSHDVNIAHNVDETEYTALKYI